MAGFDAHDRIGLWVEGGFPAEHLHGDGIGLDAVAASGKRFLHDIAQEPPAAIGRVELRTVKDAVKLGLAVGCRNLAWPALPWFPLPQGQASLWRQRFRHRA